MSFESGRTYPLRDPTRYDDDDFGTGYGFARADQGTDGCFIADCWIVDGHGRVHPGYSESPVPIRYQDVVDDPMETLRSYAG